MKRQSKKIIKSEEDEHDSYNLTDFFQIQSTPVKSRLLFPALPEIWKGNEKIVKSQEEEHVSYNLTDFYQIQSTPVRSRLPFPALPEIEKAMKKSSNQRRMNMTHII